MTGPAAPPGWYRDPWSPWAVRWWDGGAWHGSTVPWTSSPWDATAAMARECTAARWARVGMWGLAVTALAGTVEVTAVVRSFADLLGRAGTAGVRAPLAYGALFPFLGVCWLLTLAGEAALMVWGHAAAEHARRLGLPARLTPVWAVVGWLVPVGALFLPYWVLRDCLPPGALAARAAVLRWWLLFVLGVPTGMVLGLLGLAGWAGAAAAVVAGAGYGAVQAMRGRVVVDTITAAHEQATAAIWGRAPAA